MEVCHQTSQRKSDPGTRRRASGGNACPGSGLDRIRRIRSRGHAPRALRLSGGGAEGSAGPASARRRRRRAAPLGRWPRADRRDTRTRSLRSQARRLFRRTAAGRGRLPRRAELLPHEAAAPEPLSPRRRRRLRPARQALAGRGPGQPERRRGAGLGSRFPRRGDRSLPGHLRAPPPRRPETVRAAALRRAARSACSLGGTGERKSRR